MIPGWERPVPSISCLLPFSPKIFTYKFITNINTATQPFGQPIDWWVHMASGLNLVPPLEVIKLWNEWWMSCSKVYVQVGAPRHWPFTPPPTPPHPKHRSLTAPAKSSTCTILKGDVRHIHHTGFAVEEVCGIERPACPCHLNVSYFDSLV